METVSLTCRFVINYSAETLVYSETLGKLGHLENTSKIIMKSLTELWCHSVLASALAVANKTVPW